MIGSSTLDVATFTGSLSTDVMIGVGLLIALTLLALYAGSSQVISIGLAALFAPVVVAFAKNAAFLSGMPLDGTGYERAMLAVMFGILAFLFKMISSDILHMTTPLQAIMAGLGTTCLLMLVWVSTPALVTWFQFGGTITAAFAEGFRFWWVMSILALFAFARM